MDKGTIMLIANLALLVILAFGFLVGLRGVKKSGLSLAFFIVSLVVTTLITPLISKALLGIKVNVDGSMLTIQEWLKGVLSESGIIKELASSGSNVEALLNGLPQAIGNLATFVALVIVVGFIFWIAYLITASIVLKKDKTPKQKNTVSKTAPSYVSATGNVTYVRDNKVKKHRLLGGLVGALHALVFVVALLIPVCGVTSLYNELAFQTEVPATTTTVSIGLLNVNSEGGSADQGASDEDKDYTATAKLIQSNVPQEASDILTGVNDSILGHITNIFNAGDIWFNSIAKCNVNGEKIVLKNEIKTFASAYNDIDYISKIDFNSVESVKSIDFDRIRKAVDNVFNSKLLDTIGTELGYKYLDWLTMDESELATLPQEIQDMVADLRTEIDKDANLKEFLVEIKKIFGDDQKQLQFFKSEINVVINIAEEIVKSDLIDLIVGVDQVDADQVIAVLNKNNNELVNKIIDHIFSSELVNLSTLTGTNYAIDEIMSMLKDTSINGATEPILTIAKITLASAQNRIDSTAVKNMVDLSLDMYNEYSTIGFDKIQNDLTLIATPNFKDNIKKYGIALDSFKNMSLWTEFKNAENITSYTAFVTNFGNLKYNMGQNEDGTTDYFNVRDYVDVSCLYPQNPAVANDPYKNILEVEFENIAPAIEKLFTVYFEETSSNGQIIKVTLFEKILNDKLGDVIDKISDEDLSVILTAFGNSKLFKPTNVMILNAINKQIQDNIGGTIPDLVPDEVDLTEEEVKQIVEIVTDAKDLIPTLKDVTDGTKTLDDVLKEVQTDPDKSSVKDTVVSILDKLQDNAKNDGVLGNVYNAMFDYVYNDDSLSDIKQIIDDNGGKENVDWNAVINQYLGLTA